MSHLTHATLTFTMLFAVACGPGPKGDQGPQGSPGVDGRDGLNGVPGLNGSSCTVHPIEPNPSQPEGGALIVCSDQSVVLVNGRPGVDGSNAPTSPYQIVALIDPCGDEGAYEEVLMQMANGTIIAHYSSGSKQFLVVLPPGQFSTTDGHACNFTVNADGSVTW